MTLRHSTIRQLQVFVEAAETLSFARVAERLGLTPAAVSFQIKQIEGLCGFALFERVGRRVVLTEAGAALVEYAAVVLKALSRCRRAPARAEGPKRRPCQDRPGQHRQIHHAADALPLSDDVPAHRHPPSGRQPARHHRGPAEGRHRRGRHGQAAGRRRRRRRTLRAAPLGPDRTARPSVWPAAAKYRWKPCRKNASSSAKTAPAPAP